MSRTLKVMGNHITFARFVLLPISEEAQTWLSFFFVPCIIKQLWYSVFVISRIIKVSVRVTSFSLRLRLITLTPTLIVWISKILVHFLSFVCKTKTWKFQVLGTSGSLNCNDYFLVSFFGVEHYHCTQLFRERLSYKRGKAYATTTKVIMGDGGFYGCSTEPQGVSAWYREGNSTNTYSFFLVPCCWIALNLNLLLPIMPIGIVVYAFTLSWDNLCRNSCI